MPEYIARDSVLTVLDWDCASQDALNAIKAIPAADVVERPHWIPVTELPENQSLLGKLICDSEGQIRIAYRVTTIGLKDKVIHTDSIDGLMFLAEECATPISEWADCTHITHYMPLPEPPQEEAPAKDTNVPTYDLLYEEGGYNSNGI